jgi:hypothetical protein
MDDSTQRLTKAFVAKIVAADGAEDELEALMTGAVELANQETGTIVWFSVKTDDNPRRAAPARAATSASRPPMS